MINMYAYTYPAAMEMFIKSGYILAKIGDSRRDVNTRMDEQGDAAEFQKKNKFGRWDGLKKIKRDHDVHKILIKRGLRHTDGKGNEWFKIPGKDLDQAESYIDEIITDLEGFKIRPEVKLRIQQKKTLDRAMEIIEQCAESEKDCVSIIANLCPRFGKTIWALMLFKRISENDEQDLDCQRQVR